MRRRRRRRRKRLYWNLEQLLWHGSHLLLFPRVFSVSSWCGCVTLPQQQPTVLQTILRPVCRGIVNRPGLHNTPTSSNSSRRSSHLDSGHHENNGYDRAGLQSVFTTEALRKIPREHSGGSGFVATSNASSTPTAARASATHALLTGMLRV